MSGTRFEATCSCAIPANCSGPCDPPRVRFWATDIYFGPGGGNYGCGTQNDWIANLARDLAQPAGPTMWLLYQASWAGRFIDGNPTGPEAHTLVELSDTYDRDFPSTNMGEGTIDHASWYLLADTRVQGGTYEYDTMQGGDVPPGTDAGCFPAVIKARAVPPPGIDGRTDPCTGSSVVSFGSENSRDRFSSTSTSC